jgi:carboxylate-amine ligase
METNFGWSTPYSVGVEEEFQLVRADSLELVSKAEPILSSFEGESIAQRIKPELLQSTVEASTRISASVAEALDDVVDLRARLRRAAAEEGTLLASAGTHPFSRYDDQDFTDRARYAELSESFGWLASRQVIFGLHVHIGMGSAEKAVACADGLRGFLPELLALSANSPFWQGRPTGLASARAKIGEYLPRTGPPPVLSSFAAFEQIVEQGVRTGCFHDYTQIWWDVRPQPRLGTIEVRICDGQTRVGNVAALTALIQSLIATLGSCFECGETLPAMPDLLLEENRWRAARDGLDASLIAVDDGASRPAPEAIRALVERCVPAAEALGCAEELELVEQLLARGSGADEQRRIHDETGSLHEVTRWLTEETASGLTSAGHRPTVVCN